MGETSVYGVRAAKRRFLQAATMVLAMAGAAALAAPVVQEAGGPRAIVAEAAQFAPKLVEPQEVERLVWRGADVDGDGQADFANPTGQDTRTHDAYGFGEFGASRDGGSRKHEGVDFIAQAGQPVVAPISGYVTKIGYAYASDPDLKFVEITNPALRYAARVFYVDPKVSVGDAVHVGDRIGRHRTLTQKYPGGMTDHVHLEIIERDGDRIDATRLITARYERVRTAG